MKRWSSHSGLSKTAVCCGFPQGWIKIEPLTTGSQKVAVCCGMLRCLEIIVQLNPYKPSMYIHRSPGTWLVLWVAMGFRWFYGGLNSLSLSLICYGAIRLLSDRTWISESLPLELVGRFSQVASTPRWQETLRAAAMDDWRCTTLEPTSEV